MPVRRHRVLHLQAFHLRSRLKTPFQRRLISSFSPGRRSRAAGRPPGRAAHRRRPTCPSAQRPRVGPHQFLRSSMAFARCGAASGSPLCERDRGVSLEVLALRMYGVEQRRHGLWSRSSRSILRRARQAESLRPFFQEGVCRQYRLEFPWLRGQASWHRSQPWIQLPILRRSSGSMYCQTFEHPPRSPRG